MKTTSYHKHLLLGVVLLQAAIPAVAGLKPCQIVDSGLTWVVEKNTSLDCLVIQRGGYVMAPPGNSLTLTNDGVETGLLPGSTYTGKLELTVTDVETIKFDESLEHDFRQAIYLDENGILAAKSVLDAAGPYRYADGVLEGVDIASEGPNFNGIYATGGKHTVVGAKLHMTGNGDDDFAGYGAAIMSSGENTTLIVDGATVVTQGAIRTAAVADVGSNLIVKNSSLTANSGQNDVGYIPNVALGTMKNVPWMLGLVGNNRATNLLGKNTRATYINSTVTAENWGVLSTDAGRDGAKDMQLTAINSDVVISGKSGYGTYVIADSRNAFYGTHIDVADYAAIVVNGRLVFAASTAENVRRLNKDLEIGLTSAELRALERRPTTVRSRRFGMMIWSHYANVDISDDTTFDTEQAVFLVKSAAARINVDGSGGARLNPKNGVLLQLMETDNPGAKEIVRGLRMTIGVYNEPEAAPVRNESFDVTTAHDTDVIANFSDIELKGDFYNSSRGDPKPDAPEGRNLVLHLKDSSLEGVVTASSAHHAVKRITALEYDQLGEVINTPAAAINNGVVVDLDRSDWTVTGTSQLTRLSVGKGSSISPPPGMKVSMTVDGTVTPIGTGDFTGRIELTLESH